ncbi:TPA: glycosyltransferase family 2 protein [Aeromonas veronii]
MLSIGAIFKNELPYIFEWIAYHQALGIENFHIVDNISDDGTSELLLDLHNLNIIKRIEYKTELGVKPQLPAYKMIINSLTELDEFITFIDADEFIRPENLDKGLSEIMSLFHNKDINAIAINWSLYGSSNCVIPFNDSLVIERFDHRANIDFPANNHYKSIVRRTALEDTAVNAHFFKISNGKYVLSDSSELNELTGLSSYVSWQRCRLNHYVIKSQKEFITKKAARGRPSGRNSDLNSKFFNNHDINEVEDHYPYWFISKVKYNIDKLKKLTGRCEVIAPKTMPLYRGLRGKSTGCIDNIQLLENNLLINGWSVNSIGNPSSGFVIVINNTDYITSFDTKKTVRHDIVAHGLSSDTQCGFEIVIDLSGVFCEIVQTISLYATENDMVTTELDISKNSEVLKTVFPNVAL